MGKNGTLACREGRPSFGLKPRAVERALKTAAIKDRMREHSNFTYGLPPIRNSADALPLDDMSSSLEQQKIDTKVRKQLRKNKLDDAQNMLEDWQADTGMAIRSQASTTVPCPAADSSSFVCAPCGGSVASWMSFVLPVQSVVPRLVATLEEPQNRLAANAVLEQFRKSHQR